MKFQKRSVKALIPVMAVALLSGCVSDSDDNDGAANEDVSTVSGSVFAAPVAGAACNILDSVGDVVAGPFVTGSDGQYSADIDDQFLNQILSVECSGGSYTDEATDELVSDAGMLAAYVAAGGLVGGGQVHATPSSTIIHSMVTEHDMSLADAREAFNAAFGFTPDNSIAPHDATVVPSDTVPEDQLLAGVQAAAFSEMTKNLGLTPAEQFSMLKGLAGDMAYGEMDGVGSTGPVLIGDNNLQLPVDANNRFAHALASFNSGAKNKSGLPSTQLGSVPFSPVATSETYRVEYSSMMGATVGKSDFTLNIKDHSGSSVIDQTVSVLPTMYMADKSHSAPHLPCISSDDGTYDCSIYYLMPSKMNGATHGYWAVEVSVGDEKVYFYPDVMMKMGTDTVKTKLMGQAGDQIAGMMGADPSARNYLLFNNGLKEAGNGYAISLFIAAKESMDSFPALVVGSTFNATFTVNNVLVEVSQDAGTTWLAMSSDGAGEWSLVLADLVANTPVDLNVRLTVNGEQKTTNGEIEAADGSNGYVTFTVTPPSAALMMAK